MTVGDPSRHVRAREGHWLDLFEAEYAGTFRWRYLDYLMQGVDGDVAAQLAVEDVTQRALASLIHAQPAHNAPGPPPAPYELGG